MKKKVMISVVVMLLVGMFLVLYAVNASGADGNDTGSEGTEAHADEPGHDADHDADHDAEAVSEVANADDHNSTAQDTMIMPEADHGHAAGASEEASEAHGHGEPKIGYMGIEDKTDIDEGELDRFVDRVQEDAYKKGGLDQIRFILFGLFFVLTYLAFAKIKAGNLSQRLKSAIDWHTLGTVTGIILLFLVIPSGIIITFFYMPTSTEVYASVEDMTDTPALAFFRNLHNWSSEIFILLSLLHAARTVSTRTFLGKRKLIWLLGALALVVGWIAFLSGTFMRGDQEALEGFEHMMYSFTLVPLGRAIADFFSGEYTLMKLTALHIGATIFIMAVTLVLHVLMRKVHVLVTTRWKKAVAYSLALTLFLVVQSFLMEAPFIVGPESGPTVSGIEATKPPWPIYFLIQGENWFGADAMVMILAVAFVPLIVFPYAVEFLPLAASKKARVGEALFYMGVFLMIGISYIAAAGEIKAHIF
jgi:ubiquinol-cytochrome c reductase cytochrome b subunit